ncbi:hypothetical protein [Halorubrum ezzemoulense]|uniref:hypothetical protein n=1 Tax=Halorubrum ezzemoulense TaxID=337243 RepID=UPI00114034CB|nr:hypothetical protein [Halorubrum ezzemoulense]
MSENKEIEAGDLVLAEKVIGHDMGCTVTRQFKGEVLRVEENSPIADEPIVHLDEDGGSTEIVRLTRVSAL